MSRVDDLRADYDLLGELLRVAEGSAAAAIARERRIMSELLEALEAPVEVPFVDEVAQRRKSRTKSAGAADRRRKSG